jgi:hypothetical protein
VLTSSRGQPKELKNAKFWILKKAIFWKKFFCVFLNKKFPIKCIKDLNSDLTALFLALNSKAYFNGYFNGAALI